MTLPLLPLIDGCLFVDNSMLELLTTCPRALEYNQLHKRVAANEKPSLNFGSAVHLALEYRYQKYQSRLLDDQYNQDVAHLLSDFFDEHPCPLDDFRNLNWAIEVVKQYNATYAAESFELLQYDESQKCSHCEGTGDNRPDGSLGRSPSCLWCSGTGKLSTMVEMSFALPLFDYKTGVFGFQNDLPASIPVLYSGRIDLPHISDNHLWVMDHKTTSILGPSFFDKMRMSAQQKGYAWAFEQLTGRKVEGYVINAIRTKEPPIYVQSGQTSKYGKKQTVSQWWSESLARERYYLKPGELDEWRLNAIALIEEFFWHYSREYMPMKTAWCNQFGRCPYFDVCSSAKADRGVMLQSGLFMDNLWRLGLRIPSAPRQ
jgi:hypothetical protein